MNIERPGLNHDKIDEERREDIIGIASFAIVVVGAVIYNHRMKKLPDFMRVNVFPPLREALNYILGEPERPPKKEEPLTPARTKAGAKQTSWGESLVKNYASRLREHPKRV
jgi:hypothetical protein